MTARRAHLMVVDDDQDILKMLEAALSAAHDVTTTSDSREALDMLRNVNVDCIVADQMMPGLTGVQLLTAAADVQPRAVRILCTASERVGDLRDAVNQAHVHHFVSKPLRVVELSHIINEALRVSALEQENQRLVMELTTKNTLLAKALSEVQEHERRLEVEVEARTRELRAAMVELEKLALRDGLTGLYNHRFFQEAMSQELARASRYGTPLGLVFLDVDHFKNYNDMLGHPAGDGLLRALAGLLNDPDAVAEKRFRGRTSDIAARYGGEEFVIILPQTNLEGAVVRAARICQVIAEHPFEGRHVQPGGAVTVSVGVTAFPDNGVNKTELISQADKMVYLAKRSGRNQVRVWGRDVAPDAR